MLEGFPPVLLAADSNHADTDIRSLAFLSRLTEALHASAFDSDLGCDAISSSISMFYIFVETDPLSSCVKSDFRGSISALREQSVTQWRNFVVSTVLADYLKTSTHSGRSDCKALPRPTLFSMSDRMSVASCQPSWSLMHALLSLSSYVHSVETPSNSTTGKHKHGIAETVVRHFVASLVDTLATGYEASEELSGAQANILGPEIP
jgi:hypothetical protein